MSAWVRSGVLVGARELIGELGGDAEALARETGIDPAALSDAGFPFPLPAAAVARFIETAATTCQCDTFGLRLSYRQDLGILGPLWPLIRSASTVGEMLNDLAAYLILHTSGLLISLETNAQGTMVHYSLASGVNSVDRHIIELGYGMIVQELRKCTPGWTSKVAQFRHGAPKNLQLHREFFGRNTEFNADRNALLIDTAMLGMRLPLSDQEAHRTLAHQFDQKRRSVPGRLKAQTESVIRSLLPFSTCDLPSVAGILRISPRSLQRGLAAEESSFNQLLDAVRADLAMHYLRQSELAIGDIAEILGFTQTSVLTRAFQRWYGVSPRAVRLGPAI